MAILLAMPREKDNEKRAAIINESKRLFAAKGFHAASVSDIALAVDLPVGSIYTYFKNKDDVIDTIIEEGWEGFRGSMMEAIGTEADPVRRLGLIIDRFLPELFKDVDFITLLLTEAGRIGRLEEKISFLSGLIIHEIKAVSSSSGRSIELDDKQAAAALLVFFLGSMDSVRIIKHSSLPVTEADILAFIRITIENAFGVKLPPSPSPAA
jgi:AcrR family transcriptional regulator